MSFNIEILNPEIINIIHDFCQYSVEEIHSNKNNTALITPNTISNNDTSYLYKFDEPTFMGNYFNLLYEIMGSKYMLETRGTAGLVYST